MKHGGMMVRSWYLIAILGAVGFFSQARADSKRVAVIEARTTSDLPSVVRGLSAALKVNHGYEIVPEADLARARQKLLSKQGTITGKQIAQLAKMVGADLVVLAKVNSPNSQKLMNVDIRVDAGDGSGPLLITNYPLPNNKLDRVAAVEIARMVRDAQVSANSSKKVNAKGDVEFVFGETTSKGQGQGLDFSAAPEGIAVDVKAVKKAAAEAQAEVAAENAEENDEFYEPSDEISELAQKRYIPTDGRLPLLMTAGLAFIDRYSIISANNGTPPSYQGGLSPGLAINFVIYPWRFKDTAQIKKDFGFFARADFVFMSSSYAAPALALNEPTPSIRHFTDKYVGAQAGFSYRHVFYNSDASPALGTEIGVNIDSLTLDNNVPFPSVLYVSPLATIIGEFPIIHKRLVLTTRVGVMPYSSTAANETAAFGQRRFAVGASGAVGLHSQFTETAYVDATVKVANYWQAFSGAGTSNYNNIVLSDLFAGFTLSAGFVY